MATVLVIGELAMTIALLVGESLCAGISIVHVGGVGRSSLVWDDEL